MLGVDQGLRVQTEHFGALIWPLRGLTKKGEGTSMGVGSPWSVTWSLITSLSISLLLPFHHKSNEVLTTSFFYYRKFPSYGLNVLKSYDSPYLYFR
jgi:hypothetical protein